MFAFEGAKFQNPEKAANYFLSVRVLMTKCPELEARLNLMSYQKRPKRRFSTSVKPHVQPNNIKRRKIFSYMPVTSRNVAIDNLNVTPLPDAPAKISSAESIEKSTGQLNQTTQQTDSHIDLDIDFTPSLELQEGKKKFLRTY